MKRVIPEYTSLEDIIQDAIDKEKDAHRFYTEAAEQAQTADIREFLLEMAEMEKGHAELLARKLESVRSDQAVFDGILSSFDDEAEPDSGS
ncbi:MAG: ferritin family protein [Bacteroidota bacterium]|jgi:rubrerythrin|nr:ferritin family protein [Bacteroidota bacterium]